MLSEEQISEIREHLEKAQNPVFFFDNDIDGLMSFILLRRYIDRGKGVAIKSFPGLDESYVRKVDELNADYVFILDKPVVSQDFIDEIDKRNLPVVWIDHHDVTNKIKGKNLSYYNPFFSKQKTNEPTSYLAYQVSQKKDDMWLAMAGCIGDNYLPDFVDEFSKKYNDIWKKDVKNAFEILYESEFGKLVIILDFALKDRTSNVVALINYLFTVKNPSDILVENSHNMNILRRYEHISSVYNKLMERAKVVARTPKKVILFQYGGEMSLSADLANELYYRFPGKVIMVTYVKGSVANISIRGNFDVRRITLKAVKEIPNATGGGHKNATGAKVMVDDLKKFVGFFEEEFD
jgi:single-stranded DNA-specific DHH superfamily exonuclease